MFEQVEHHNQFSPQLKSWPQMRYSNCCVWAANHEASSQNFVIAFRFPRCQVTAPNLYRFWLKHVQLLANFWKIDNTSVTLLRFPFLAPGLLWSGTVDQTLSSSPKLAPPGTPQMTSRDSGALEKGTGERGSEICSVFLSTTRGNAKHMLDSLSHT